MRGALERASVVQDLYVYRILDCCAHCGGSASNFRRRSCAGECGEYWGAHVHVECLPRERDPDRQTDGCGHTWARLTAERFDRMIERAARFESARDRMLARLRESGGDPHAPSAEVAQAFLAQAFAIAPERLSVAETADDWLIRIRKPRPLVVTTLDVRAQIAGTDEVREMG